ncbi:MAG: hypothetical protein ISR58_17425 [Anaerolineales bacterium]|nr:hypothetical protein [Chloroflexota bacterium]MBL6982958.1 hypothetical protein [Anaerolineales bacterium]
MFNDRDLAILGVGAALAVMCLLLPFEFSVKVVFGIILLALAMVLALLRLGPDRVPLETWFYRRFRFWLGSHRFVYHREGYAVGSELGHDDRVPAAKPGFWPAYLAFDEVGLYPLMTAFMAVVGTYFVVWIHDGGGNDIALFFEMYLR